MLLKNSISSSQIISTAGFRPRSKTFEFICTESNRDKYLCDLILRKTKNNYKLKLTHYAGILEYPAFQVSWIFKQGEEDFAIRVADLIEREIERIQENHNQSMKHPTNLTPIIREAIRPIAVHHRIEKYAVPLREIDIVSGESDWEQSVYGNRYPEYTEGIQEQFVKDDNHPKESIKRTLYKGRNKKVTKKI